MRNKENSVRTRFAPSPTGGLHVGGVRTALFNYLFAKQNKGSFVLRTENTDKKRNIDKFAKEQYDYLVWLGISPDESSFNEGEFAPYRQSDRLQIYKDHLEILIKKKKAYYCFCTKEELEEERRNYHLSQNNRYDYKYSRKCFFLGDEEISSKLALRKSYLVRIFIQENKIYKFVDLIRGEVSFTSENIEDFVLCREDGVPLLNFAVVVDDHLMKITHVLRAEEHLSNTAKQLALYECFDWEAPEFSHLSIILNSEKKKISKRDKESKFQSVESLKKIGYLPQAIINYLIFLGWSSKSNDEIFSLQEMIENFEISDLNSRPPVFSVEKLNWFNNNWIRKISTHEYEDIAWKFIKPYFSLEEKEKAKSLKISELFREQLVCFSELPILAESLFWDQSKKVNGIPENINKSLEEIASDLLCTKEWTEGKIKEILLSKLYSKSRDEKRELFLNLRKVITGNQKGPELPKIIFIIGKDEVKKRLKKTLVL